MPKNDPKEPNDQPRPDESEVIHNTRRRHVIKGNQYRSGGWLISPANLELFVASYRSLASVAKRRGMQLSEVEKVRLARRKHEEIIWIYPTTSTDVDGIEIVHTGGSHYINMIDFLTSDDDEEVNLTLARGHKERFELPVKSTENGSPVGWALCLDLNKPLATATLSRTRKKAETAAKKTDPQNPAPDTPEPTP